MTNPPTMQATPRQGFSHRGIAAAVLCGLQPGGEENGNEGGGRATHHTNRSATISHKPVCNYLYHTNQFYLFYHTNCPALISHKLAHYYMRQILSVIISHKLVCYYTTQIDLLSYHTNWYVNCYYTLVLTAPQISIQHLILTLCIGYRQSHLYLEISHRF